MIRSWLTAGGIALALGGLTAPALQGTVALAQESPTWLTDLVAAREAARKANRPIFLVFR